MNATPLLAVPLEHRRAAAQLMLRSGRELSLEVQGDSMEPTLLPGCRVGVRALGAGGPAAGDVVAYFAGERLISHRVVAVGRSGTARGTLLTQGDNRRLPDPPLSTDRVLGIVTLGEGQRECLAPVAASSARARRADSRLVTWLAGLLLEVHPRLASCLAIR